VSGSRCCFLRAAMDGGGEEASSAWSAGCHSCSARQVRDGHSLPGATRGVRKPHSRERCGHAASGHGSEIGASATEPTVVLRGLETRAPLRPRVGNPRSSQARGCPCPRAGWGSKRRQDAEALRTRSEPRAGCPRRAASEGARAAPSPRHARRSPHRSRDWGFRCGVCGGAPRVGNPRSSQARVGNPRSCQARAAPSLANARGSRGTRMRGILRRESPADFLIAQDKEAARWPPRGGVQSPRAAPRRDPTRFRCQGRGAEALLRPGRRG